MDDDSIKTWISTEDETVQNAIVSDFAGSIDLSVMTIAELFQDLQPYLANEETPLPEISRALALLSRVIDTIQAPLDRKDVHHLVIYFADRLANESDIPSFRAGIEDCATILLSLATMDLDRFMVRDAPLVLSSVLFLTNKSGVYKNYTSTTRLALLKLVNHMVNEYKEILIVDVGKKSIVEGVASMGEFEKDPTCLELLFGLYHRLSVDWDIDQEGIKLLFSSYIRYYPIKFGGRTAAVPSPDQLRQSLLNLFVSNDSYAKHAFPRLIELLDTNQDLSANVKNDVFVTMAACMTCYSTPEIVQWAPKVWDSLKFEVWNGENDEFIRGTLDVINKLTKSLSRSPLNVDDIETLNTGVLLAILTECSNRLVDGKQKYLETTGSILHAIASASPYAFSCVAKRLIPVLLNLWHGFTTESEKSTLLSVLNQILQARLLLDQQQNSVLGNGQVPLPSSMIQANSLLASSLVQYQRSLIDDVYFSAMTENISESPDGTHFRAVTIKGLVLLMSIQNLLSDFEKGTIIESLNSILLRPNQVDTLCKEATAALQTISSDDPTKFQNITLTNFASKLPSTISSDGAQKKAELDSAIYLLDSLAKIACTATSNVAGAQLNSEALPRDQVFFAFQKALLAKLASTLQHEGQLFYGNVILGAIYQGVIWYDAALDEKSKSPRSATSSVDDSQYHPFAWVVLELYQNVVKTKQTQNGTSYTGLSLSPTEDEQTTDKFISLLGSITTLALRSSQTTSQNNFLNSARGTPNQCSQIWSLFVRNAPGDIGATQSDLVNVPIEKSRANVLSMSLVAGVRREDKARLQIDIGIVAAAMITNAASTESNASQFARASTLHFLQLLVNKFGALDGKSGDLTVVQVMEDLIQRAATNTNKLEVERAYQALSYFTSAALASCHPSSGHLIGLMVVGLKHPQVGRKVAQSFRVLLAPSKIMSKENFCIIRPLRHGRLFQFGIEEIKKLWRESSFTQPSDPNVADVKTNCLIALAGGLAYMDSKVYLNNVNDILPLILEGTNIQNEDFTKLACINIIRTVIPACSDVITTYLDSVINRMTDRTHNTYYSPSDANAACRVAALDVLALLPKHVDSTALLKRRSKILTELDTALNDVSMEVRQRAQKCKMGYFNLES